MIDRAVPGGLGGTNKRFMGCLGESEDPQRLWYAVQVRSRHEKFVGQILEQRGVGYWLPLLERRSKWPDRWVTVYEPLFRGYIFTHQPTDNMVDVISTRGVVRVVGLSGRPSPIPFSELKSVEKAICSSLAYDPYPGLYPGVTVEITKGPLQGCRGILTKKDKKHRIVIEVKLIGQAMVLDIEAADVQPV